MINKIEIIDNRILELENQYALTLEYINMIDSGMEDPDITIEQCQARLLSILEKKQALVDYRQTIV